MVSLASIVNKPNFVGDKCFFFPGANNLAARAHRKRMRLRQRETERQGESQQAGQNKGISFIS